ncbi:MAG: hypothetical protein ACRDXX_10985 [Stackebrandtia sp.]
MNDADRDAARLLRPLRDLETGAPSGVNVARAMRSGRRSMLARRAAGTVACVLAVIGLATTATLIRHAPAPPAASSFDVTVQGFEVGSAGGFTPLTYETGQYRQRVELGPEDPAELGGSDAVITMYAKGHLPDDWRPSGQEAPDVNGGQARWLDEPVIRDGAVEMAWEWAPDTWAFVSLTGPAAGRDRAHTVALGVTPGADVQVDTPAVLPEGALEDAQVTGTVVSIGHRERASRVIAVRYGVDDGWVDVGVRQPGPHEGEVTTVDGRDVLLEPTRVTFLDDPGLFLEVSDEGVLERIGGADGLLRLAGEAVLDEDFEWSPKPPLSSASPSPSEGGSSSGSESPTGDPTPT